MNYKDYNDYELLNYIAEGSEDASNILLKKYEPLITKISLKMLPYCKNNGIELNDLIQEGMIGLNHAVEKYKEMSDALFYTYAKTCIERKIISIIVSSNRKKNKVLNESISYDDDDNLLIKFIKDSDLNPEEKVIKEEFEQDLINKINLVATDLEKEVLNLLILGFKYDEIAIMLDRDKKSIDNAIQRLKVKIKKASKSD